MERKILRKIDLRILPMLCALCAISQIDRVNIGTAKIAGMVEELELTGNRYSVALLIFFPTYVCAELPANIIAKRFGAMRYLSLLAFCWGVTALSQGLVQTYGQLCALRVLLGLFEGGLNPICAFIITAWYKRFEVQQRLAIWFITGATVAGFNGLLSYALSKMDGVGGYRGWRWIFIIPGIVSVLIALLAPLLLADFPEKARFLTEDERRIVIRRLALDHGEEIDERITMEIFLSAVTDWKVHVVAIFLVFPSSSAYAMAYFSPTILSSFGFSEALSLLLTTPPYLFACILVIGLAIFADRLHRRSPLIIACCVGVIVGYVMMGWGNNTGCKLVGVFIAIGANYCIIPTAAAFLVNNVPGHGKRAVAVSMQWVWSAIGGIVGSNIFQEKDAPTYRPGLYIGIAFNIALIALTTGITVYFYRQNRNADEKGEDIADSAKFRYVL
ncbi:major facilitator superfamily domain-containing protein [Aspergillus unguis]